MKSVESYGVIGVLKGGVSSERDISLKSAAAVEQALIEANCRVVGIDITSIDKDSIIDLIEKADINIAFIALHGKLGEDGQIQRLLEQLNIPYTGSGVEASERSFNKGITSILLAKAGIPVAQHVLLKKIEEVSLESIKNELGDFPFIVKPTCEGSSIGVFKVNDVDKLGVAIKEAFFYGHEVLVEKYIDGREVTVSILNDEALSIVEIVAAEHFFDFNAKYANNSKTAYIVPANLPEQDANKIKELALKAYRLLGCQDCARVDFKLDHNLNPFVLEINTIPGMTSSSLLPKAAKASGISFQELCLTLVDCAYAKKKEKI